MWRDLGVPWQWSIQDYGRKLRISGGRERLTSLFDDPGFLAATAPPADQTSRSALVARWHQYKSTLFQRLIESGCIPPRPGVRRLCAEALDRGWKLAVASTSALASVEAMLHHAVGAELRARFSAVVAWEAVPNKKPAPDVYHLAARKLDVAPWHCLAIEDSANGVRAAVAAGMRCLVTVSNYTRDEDFSEAILVVDGLGDPAGEPCRVLENRSKVTPGRCLTVDDLDRLVAEVSRPGA
jgi:HAD superfamily hydrolase (TIGR01509 family)